MLADVAGADAALPLRCRYQWVPFPFPNGIFDDRWRDVLCGLFSAPLP